MVCLIDYRISRFIVSFIPANTPGSERVLFALGTPGSTDFIDDEEHQTHDIFCEMDELRQVGEDGRMEWKETAR